jgi:acyl-coenzyme A synthetase/AMP-(fatty) acid ligase
LLLFWCGHADPLELENHLKANLSNAMIPNEVIYLENMPVNANGKVDRLALSKLSIQKEIKELPQNLF